MGLFDLFSKKEKAKEANQQKTLKLLKKEQWT